LTGTSFLKRKDQGCILVVEPLPRMYKTLDKLSSTGKEREERQEKERKRKMIQAAVEHRKGGQHN
jgi:hypothetical protein